MSPSRPFILRPVATSLCMAAIVLAGIVGFHFLPLSALPEVDYPTIQVETQYPGASPEVMSQTVTAPLERNFGEMPGLDRMSSISSAGASVITLQFSLQLPLDEAEQEVQAAINASNALLPQDLPAPPIYAKVNPADAPILSLAITSTTVPIIDAENLVETRLAQKLSQLPGVGLVTVNGASRPAVRIQVDTQLLASIGLTLDQLRTVISNQNSNEAKGSFDGPTRDYSINANDQLYTASDYGNLIIAYHNGAPVRLKDVGTIVQGPENDKLAAWENTTPAIVVNVQRQPGANVIETVDAIKAHLPEIFSSLQGLHPEILTDRTIGIRASVRDVELELLLAIFLVILVIFLFLHSVQATIIAGLAVPISLVGTFGAMYLMGYSINNLTLMSLTIASGFVVDDAIVMIENISRHLEGGLPPLQAALKGAEQIGFTIISLTVSLVAVLIPLLFMGDVVGRLFREFAVTLATTIVISAVVSLTLTASLSARWLKREPHVPPSGLGHHWQIAFDKVVVHYDRGLRWVFDHQGATLIVAFLTLVLTAVLYILMPKGLFPTQDTGELMGVIEARQSISFDRMKQLEQDVARAILQDPDVQSLSSFVGVDGVNSTTMNTGRMYINLKPFHDRPGQETVMERLYQLVGNVPGVTLYLQPVQDLTIDAESGPTQYQFALQGADPNQVTHWTQALVTKLRQLPELRNVVSDTLDQGLAVLVDIDRDTAGRLSVTAATVDEALYSAFGQRIISNIFTDTNEYRVILEEKPGVVRNPSQLDLVNVATGSGTPTPLTSIASVKVESAPLQITRAQQFPAANIGFDTTPGVSLGRAVDSIRDAERAIGIPPAITTVFLGATGAYQASLANELWLIVAAIVCVYIVLGVLYESFVHPLTILSTLPSAGVGALLALLITGSDLDVIGIIGIVLLIGIVKKNAIMMIDFAIEAEREGGKSALEAIHEAALLRFRPILMTTMAALFAAVPLMLGTGVGHELRSPLGVSIFGGLIVSQLLTLFTTPVIYLAFDRLTRRYRYDEAPPAGHFAT